MIALPSIAFSDFSGTAGDVTAKKTKSGTVLTARPFPSKVATPAQKVSRNSLSHISRKWRELSDDQMRAWNELATHLKGISTFGLAAEMTGHNAFVKLNSNRKMVGKPLLSDAPEYIYNIPQVEYEDFWVSPTMIVFTGIERPQESYRLVMKMSGSQSNGISNGWSKAVIVAPGVEEDWGEANITRLYTSTIGYTPQVGEKVFIDIWWMDENTGFVGETLPLMAIVKEDSQVEGEIYVPRNQVTQNNLTSIKDNPTINRYNIEQSDGIPVMTADVEIHISGYVSGIEGNMQDLPPTYVGGRCYFPARGKGRCEYGISLMENYTYWRNSYGTFRVASRFGKYDPDFELFGTSCMVNY